MAAQLEVTVNSTNEKLGYTGSLRSHPVVPIDYIPPLGDGQGYTPLELLLMSLGSCSGGTIGLLLRKMGKTVSGIKVNTKGIRCEQHPTSFQKIFLEFIVHSSDVKDADIQKGDQACRGVGMSCLGDGKGQCRDRNQIQNHSLLKTACSWLKASRVTGMI